MKKQKTKSASIKDIFGVTLAYRWSQKAREDVERRNIKEWEDYLGEDRRVSSVTLGMVDKFVSKCREKGNKPSTINSKLGTLKTALDFSRDRGMHSNELRVSRLSHPSDERTTYFSKEDQEVIEGMIDDSEFKALFVWSIETGMRPSESKRVRASDISEHPQLGWIVTLRETKNGTPRVIPLTPKAKDAWDSVEDFSRFESFVISRYWARLRRKDPEFLNDYVFYTCRHTCATRLLSCGVNVKVVQDWMGHKDIKMTLRYAKLVPSDLCKARDLMFDTYR